MQSEASLLESSLEAVAHQLSASQAVFIAAEADHDQPCCLIDAEAQRRQDIEALLAQSYPGLYDHSSLLLSSHMMLLYDFNQALHEYLQLFLDAVCKSTVAFRSASTRQVDTHCKTLHQRASSITSYLDLSLSSSFVVNNSGSTTSNPADPGGPSPL